MPSQWVAGFPVGIWKSGADGVSVGGKGVTVGFFVGVTVRSGVKVNVGKFVAVEIGVVVGFATKALQDIIAATKANSTIALPNDFILAS
jgi:hypothetical protein